jgi:hypothetical protein
MLPRNARSWYAPAFAVLLGYATSAAHSQDAPEEGNAPAVIPAAEKDKNAQLPDAQPQGGPAPLPDFQLQKLPTTAVRRGEAGFTQRGNKAYNWIEADAAALPKDRDGIWVLEFAYKPVRIIEVEVPGKGRRKVYYLYYRIVNRTGQPRVLVPQFSLVTDDGKRLDDIVLPLAVEKIRAKEDPTIRLLGGVNNIGEIPASTKDGIDDAIYGVAIWPEIDHKADAFKIFVRGLSDGYQEVQPPQGGKPFTRFKALSLDFKRPGDERAPHPSEIQVGDPPFEWTYYP